MPKRVLEVGNCDADHGQIRQLLESQFDVNVVRCHSREDAISALRAAPADLVLVNRILDRDQSLGLDIIREIKADTALAKTPCMLLTNFPEHQQTAIGAGAEVGFGKAELHEPETCQKLARVLA